jgi:prepilin-type processing-associated H-X9-DG protein
VVTVVARGDYAACSGDTNQELTWIYDPVPYATGDSPGYQWNQSGYPYRDNFFTGVSFRRSEIKMCEITDGTSCTYMLGEKYMNPNDYFTGIDPGDNQSLFCGWNSDNYRITGAGSQPRPPDPAPMPPMQDTPGLTNVQIFGSAHSNGFHMAFCDGSVQRINYSIDGAVHACLGNRKDGVTIDAKKF